MEKLLPVLKRTKLFSGLNDNEILSVLKCLNANSKVYVKNAMILCEGDEAKFIGIIISGEVETQKTDYDGNINIISRLCPSDIIAGAVCYSSDNRVPFDAIATSSCEILCLNINSLISTCCNNCSFHTTIIKNLLGIISDKNLLLADKIDILTKRTIREKVLAYLYSQSKKAKNKKFSVSLSRRQMAEFFSVSRSALSKELSNMQNNGLIEFKQNQFVLKMQSR